MAVTLRTDDQMIMTGHHDLFLHAKALQEEIVSLRQLAGAAPDLLELAELIAMDYDDAADWKDARGKLASMARAAVDKARGE